MCTLVLATSFGLYGLMRKLAPVGALVGLTIETALLLPLTAGYLAWAIGSGRGTRCHYPLVPEANAAA